MTPVEFVIRLRTKTGLNSREHWAARAVRVNMERRVTLAHLRALTKAQRSELTWELSLERPLQVTLTRVGPRKVDDDGAVGGLKGVRDEIAYFLGRDDGDPSLVWRYATERGPYAVRVRIEPAAAVCPTCGHELAAKSVETAREVASG